MEKTIEERILDKCNKEWSTKYTDASQIHDELDRSYYDGCVETAKEQQDEDIEKAVEWLKYNAWSFAHTSDGVPYYDTEMAIDTFRQAMEEK